MAAQRLPDDALLQEVNRHLMAGWTRCGVSKGGLVILERWPER